jgi:hypothetical protein
MSTKALHIRIALTLLGVNYSVIGLRGPTRFPLSGFTYY